MSNKEAVQTVSVCSHEQYVQHHRTCDTGSCWLLLSLLLEGHADDYNNQVQLCATNAGLGTAKKKFQDKNFHKFQDKFQDT